MRSQRKSNSETLFICYYICFTSTLSEYNMYTKSTNKQKTIKIAKRLKKSRARQTTSIPVCESERSERSQGLRRRIKDNVQIYFRKEGENEGNDGETNI